jgi:GNAT superfamily N-acetyltransferase
MIGGLEEYRSFLPADWDPPPLDAELEYTRALLARDDVWCLIAEAGGSVVGQVTVLPAAGARDAVEEPGLAHFRNLFVDPAYWGSGLARELHRAAVEEASRRTETRSAGCRRRRSPACRACARSSCPTPA